MHLLLRVLLAAADGLVVRRRWSHRPADAGPASSAASFHSEVASIRSTDSGLPLALVALLLGRVGQE